MTRLPLNALAALLGFAVAVAAWTARDDRQDEFDHLQHEGLFPTCQGCHQPSAERMTIPDAESCLQCHDGEREDEVDWEPSPRPPSNLVFDHARELEAGIEGLGVGDEPCQNCHVPAGAQRLDVRRAVVERCLDCHWNGAEHYTEAPCGDCHIRLAAAASFTADDLRDFPLPLDHEAERFLFEHAPPDDDASRCAVCHARESCSSCHVNAPTVTSIQALPADPRIAALMAEKDIVYPTPDDHRDDGWLLAHGGGGIEGGAAECETCHARNSCQTCHVGVQPDAVLQLPPGPGDATVADEGAAADLKRIQERGPGVTLAREPPPSHTPWFIEDHRAEGAAATAGCQVCHTQSMCASCHSGSEAVLGRAAIPSRFHPRNFLRQHNAPGFGSSIECASCHNTEAFCRDCHAAQGLVGEGRFDTGFHDGESTFVLGHGQAARQGLESCATCHSQRDCVQCHSARGGRRVNPHGPDFDPGRVRSRNGQMCLFCHFTSILDR